MECEGCHKDVYERVHTERGKLGFCCLTIYDVRQNGYWFKVLMSYQEQKTKGSRGARKK